MSGFRLRWWMWLIAAGLVLLSAGLVIRWHGLARLAETQAELRRLGYPTTMEELVATAPSVDRDRQARMSLLMNSRAKWMDNIHHALPANDLRESRFAAADLAKRDQALQDGASSMAELERLLAEGPVELSVFGWCERDPAKLRSIDVNRAASSPLPNLTGVRAFVDWWSIQACLAADPEPHLRNLDRLIACQKHPGTLIDAMIGLACHEIRDQVHLWLACRGRLADERLRSWAGEAPHQLAWCAGGYAGERCVFQEPLSRMRWDRGSLTFLGGGFFSGCWMFLRSWPTQGHEAASTISILATVETDLLGRPRPTPRPTPFGYVSPLGQLLTHNLIECSITATEAATRHRLSRCAALVAAAFRRNGVLAAAMPPDAPARAINANQPALHYERLSPSRFRIGVDPHGPCPPLIPPDRWVDRWPAATQPGMIGTPAITRATTPSKDARWALEIDLDAILIPPPAPPARPAKPARVKSR